MNNDDEKIYKIDIIKTLTHATIFAMVWTTGIYFFSVGFNHVMLLNNETNKL